MIDKFLLVDNCDENYAQLISFESNVSLSVLEENIEKTKEKIGYDTYTNEDILEGLDELNIEFNCIDLFNLEKIYF